MAFRKLELDAVNRAVRTLDGAAGKSINVAKVLKTLGAHPLAVGFVGGDRGRELIELLESKRIEGEFVNVGAPTRQCISILDESAQTVTELVEESRAVAESDYSALKEIIANRLPVCQAVVMSGSLTPGGPVNFYREITLQAKAAGVLALVDAQGPALIAAMDAYPDVVKPNRKELAATVGHALESETEVIAAMKEVRHRGAARIVVTAGGLPALAMHEEQLWRIHSPSVSVVNPIGSGDSFTAALTWRLVQKDSLGEACRWAAAAGAANALSAMPGELERTDVERLADQVKVERI